MLRAFRLTGLLQPLSQRWQQGLHTTAAASGLNDFFDSPRKQEERATAGEALIQITCLRCLTLSACTRPRLDCHTGRSWKASELRLKSWDDLHKLWSVLPRLDFDASHLDNGSSLMPCSHAAYNRYVLLKERNMLQSEALAAFAQQKGLQNPFRVRKVLLVCHPQSCYVICRCHQPGMVSMKRLFCLCMTALILAANRCDLEWA